MNIYINNKQQQIGDHANITDVLRCINVTTDNGIAIAINNNVIPKADWNNYTLNDEDKITLIKATQGG